MLISPNVLFALGFLAAGIAGAAPLYAEDSLVPPAARCTPGGISASDISLQPEDHQPGPICDVLRGAARISLDGPEASELLNTPFDIILGRQNSGGQPAAPPVILPGTSEISAGAGGKWYPVDDPLPVRAAGMSANAAGMSATPLRWRLSPDIWPEDAGKSFRLRWRYRNGSPSAPGLSRLLRVSQPPECAARVTTAPVRQALDFLRPELRLEMQARNVSRRSPFSRAVYAAEGDEVEWQLKLRNAGSASAGWVTALVTSDDSEAFRSVQISGEPGGRKAFAGEKSFSGIAPEGLRAFNILESISGTCTNRRVRFSAAWSCTGTASGERYTAPETAELIRRLDPQRVRTRLAVTDPGGSGRPGASAAVSLTLENRTGALSEAEFGVDLPAEYVLDTSLAPQIRRSGPWADKLKLDVTSSGEDGQKLVFSVRRIAGPEAAIPAEQDLTIDFRLRQIAHPGSSPVPGSGPGSEETSEAGAGAGARVVGSSVSLSARAGYSGKCGEYHHTREASVSWKPRKPGLLVTIRPLDEEFVAHIGERRRFIISVKNTGSAAADDLLVNISPGEAWNADLPAYCARQGARKLACQLRQRGALGPGAQMHIPLELELSESEGGLSLDVEAVARAVDAAGDPGSFRLARARDAYHNLGFHITQKVVSQTRLSEEQIVPVTEFEPAPEVYEIELGRIVTIGVSARWFGMGERSVHGASIAIDQPAGLEFLSARQTGGAVTPEEVLRPEPGDAGVVLLPLEPFSGNGKIQLELSYKVTDPGDGDTRLSLLTDALFSVGGRTFGIEPVPGRNTEANLLDFQIRHPRLEFSLAFSPPAGADGDYHAGDIIEGTVRVRNTGDAEAWMLSSLLQLTGPLELLDFADDRLDNDGNGVVDDAFEAQLAHIRGVAREPGEILWLGFEYQQKAQPANAVKENHTAERLNTLLAGTSRQWRFAARLKADTTPATSFGVLARGRFSAQSPAMREAHPEHVTPEYVLRAGVEAATAPLRISLRRIGAPSFGEVPLRPGRSLGHEISLIVPNGRVGRLKAEVTLPPAIGDVVIGDYLAGTALDCRNGEPPQIAGEVRRVLIWTLGDCEVAREDAFSRRASVAIAVRAAEDRLRTAWRSGVIAASAQYEGAGGAVPGGISPFRIVGPILELTAAWPEGQAPTSDEILASATRDVPLRVRAGQEISAEILLRNIGDEEGDCLAFNIAAGPADRVDCASIALGRLKASARHNGAAGCMVTFEVPRELLDIDGQLRYPLRARISERAMMGAEANLQISVTGGSAVVPDAPRISSNPEMLEVETPSPAAPVITRISRGDDTPLPAGGAEPGMLNIGDRIVLQAAYPFPAGRARGEIQQRLRLRRQSSAESVTPPPFRLIRSSLSVRAGGATRAELSGGRKIAEEAEGTFEFVQTRIEGGWAVRAIPLEGPLEFFPEARSLIWETEYEIMNLHSASAGRLVEMVADTQLSGRIFGGTALTPAEITEPFLQASAELPAFGLENHSRRVAHLKFCNAGSAPAAGLRFSVQLPRGYRLKRLSSEIGRAHV